MLEIKAKLKTRGAAYNVQVRGRLPLPFAARWQGRGNAMLDSGEEVALQLPAGERLRGGDLVTASDGRVIEIVAQPEKLLHIVCASPKALATAAYALGSAHVPVEFGEGFLRIAPDSAAADMLQAIGAALSETQAPFEPVAVEHDHSSGDHDHEHCGHDHHHDHHHR